MNGKTHQWDRRLTEREITPKPLSIVPLFIANVISRWREWRIKRTTVYVDLCKVNQRVYPDAHHRKGE